MTVTNSFEVNNISSSRTNPGCLRRQLRMIILEDEIYDILFVLDLYSYVLLNNCSIAVLYIHKNIKKKKLIKLKSNTTQHLQKMKPNSNIRFPLILILQFIQGLYESNWLVLHLQLQRSLVFKIEFTEMEHG
ncbi:Hypothetical_protein [Hexamita inflata]|uniref:Hypothetical_protein n=1 Tax=Hexamita inflata TaxID=28002 RepID=A0AA86TL90_9EUKA|nr:Hypothetical protein HINF_LOCUS6707 [Hexamita inflata]